jgi:hypothetical protein
MLKGNSSKKVGFRGLIDTVEADFGNFQIEFLGEFTAICKTASACESGPCGGGGGRFMKRTEGRKSRDTVPVKSRVTAELDNYVLQQQKLRQM